MWLAFCAIFILDFQDPSFPDTPKNHWVYEGVAYLKSQGLGGYINPLGRGPFAFNRYEFAVSFHGAATMLGTMEDGFEASLDHIARGNPGASVNYIKAANDQLKTFSNPVFRKAIKYLARADKEFAPELKELGARRNDLLVPIFRYRRLVTIGIPEPGSALKQFRDVPFNHWAAKAVLDLRSEGILQGYPGNLFR